MSYTVVITPKAQRQIRKLSEQVQERIIRGLRRLEANPRPDGCLKLSGEVDSYRIREGDYLEAITFDENGKLYGSYTNGQVRAIYQLALATFANEEALEQMGGNLYRETFVSGQAVMGPPNTGMTGAIQSYALEQSNVDMADQFVDMITVQRGYQGNSRIISTTNSMLDDLMNIIR